MSDKTSFRFKPILRESDLGYVRGVIAHNQALSVRGLDGTSDVHGYSTGILEFGEMLGILFWRATASSVVFLYRRLGSLGDWKWLKGVELGDNQDGPDFADAVLEMHRLVVDEEDLCQTK